MLAVLYKAIVTLLLSLRLAFCKRKIHDEQSLACDIVLSNSLFKLQDLRDYVANRFCSKYFPDPWYIFKPQAKLSDLLEAGNVDSADLQYIHTQLQWCAGFTSYIVTLIPDKPSFSAHQLHTVCVVRVRGCYVQLDTFGYAYTFNTPSELIDHYSKLYDIRYAAMDVRDAFLKPSELD